MESIKEKKIHVIRELGEQPEVVTGIAEGQPASEDRYENQKARAEANIAKAEELKSKLKEITAERDRINSKLETANQKYNEWLQVESEMYRAIQPFSMPALQSKLEYATNETESVSETLASSFLDGQHVENDTSEFIKTYRKERKTYHLRREQLQRWKEERVGRT